MNKIVCFGETLWDLLPTGKVAGGAPMNVAVHAKQLGLEASMISRVGDDELGNNLIHFLQERKVATHNIQTDIEYKTGIVEVELSAQGSPSYTIASPAAWDFITTDNVNKQEAMQADAFVYGSLATRSEKAKNTLFELLNFAKMKVLDVNLRQPFFSKELVIQLLTKADFVKVNDEELSLICSWLSQDKGDISNAHYLKIMYNLKAIVVTRGSNGAFFIDEDGRLFEHKGFKVSVTDTIGSGDSFLAAFLKKWLTYTHPESCLAYACAVGALVATHQGATPIITENEINQLAVNNQ